MASRHRTNTASYNTYGSVAYAPAYEGGALRSPKERTLQPQPKVRTHERTRSLTRTKVQVREAGEISPFAVVGFLAVGVFAVLVIFSYAQFTVANSQLSSLRSELSDLQAQNVTLSAGAHPGGGGGHHGPAHQRPSGLPGSVPARQRGAERGSGAVHRYPGSPGGSGGHFPSSDRIFPLR